MIGKDRFRPLKQNGYGKFSLLTLGGTSWQANVSRSSARAVIRQR